MKRSKSIITALLVLVLISVLFGSSAFCSPVEIQFWDMVWGPKEYIETATKLVDKFNQENKDFKVIYQSTPWSNWYQTFATAIASGTAPDISTGGGYQAFQFAKLSDAILPIDDVIAELKSTGKAKDYSGNSLEMMKYKGHYYALPWMIDIRSFWYRKDLFEQSQVQPPKNWAELRKVLKQLTKGNTFGTIAAGNANQCWHFLVSMMVNNGGGIFDANGNVVAKSARNMETYKFLSDIAADGSINPAGVGFDNDTAIKSFAAGRTAIYLSGPDLENRLPELKGKIAVMSPIAGPHGNKGVLCWNNNIMIYKDSKHPKEAKAFLKWWSENQKVLFTEGHCSGLPVRKSFSEDRYFTQNENVAKILKEYVPIGKSTGTMVAGLFPELNEIEGDTLLRNAMQGLVLKLDYKQIANNIQTGITEIMKKGN